MGTEVLIQKQSKEAAFQEAIGSHKNNLLQMNLMNSAEIDVIIDSIISSQDIVKDILGKTVYQQIYKHNPDFFNPKKKIYSKEHDEDLLRFTTKYITEKKDQFIKTKIQEQQEKTKQEANSLTKQKLSDSPLEQKKQAIKESKALLQILKEKKYPSSLFFSSLVKKDSSIVPIAEKLSDFFVEYSPAEKKKFEIFKKRYPQKTAFSFLQETGEPIIDTVIFLIHSLEKKLGSTITQTKEKIKNTLTTTKENIIIPQSQILLREQQAEHIYHEYIKEGTDKYYSEKEKKEGQKLEKYMQEQIQNHTCPSFDSTSLRAEQLTSPQDLHKGGRTAIKKDGTIFVDKGLIEQISFNQKKLTDFFLSGEWNLRDYIFNRFVEYIAMEIIPNSIAKSKKELDAFSIIKTSSNDDTFGGADFVMKEKIKKGETDEVWLDLIISDNPKNIEKKYDEAEKRSFLIDSFLHDITKDNKPFTGFQNVKTVISFDPLTFYPLFVEFVNNLKKYGTILGPKYKNIRDFLDIEVGHNPNSQVENLYKIAYKALNNRSPKHEFSEAFNGFVTNTHKALLQVFTI